MAPVGQWEKVETPPRAWGRRSSLGSTAGMIGNTPTCVGKTRFALRFTSTTTETPPRAWGRPFKIAPAGWEKGNTPTCVGKTRESKNAAVEPWKHPHVRGEDRKLHWQLLGSVETPPRAWGRPLKDPFATRADRNTPTCVGKTPEQTLCQVERGKHPHVRGEDCCLGLRTCIAVETPPRAWGRPVSTAAGWSRGGNTPTCVGKTHQAWQACWATQKHPHVRGEDRLKPFLAPGQAETPPRAWGRRTPASSAKPWYGNTPTCVGKTPAPPPTATQKQKHPHVRGEDLLGAG